MFRVKHSTTIILKDLCFCANKNVNDLKCPGTEKNKYLLNMCKGYKYQGIHQRRYIRRLLNKLAIFLFLIYNHLTNLKHINQIKYKKGL